MSAYKVLIPLDGSRVAEHSLAFLPSLAHLGAVSVDLVSVVDETEDIHLLTKEELVGREENLLSTYLREVAADIEKHLAMRVTTSVHEGRPADLIVQRASTAGPDMLIISTHGRSGIARWRRGSVADKVIRGVNCPTLVVGPRAAEHARWFEAETVAPFREILVPLDGSGLAEQAVPVAMQFAGAFGARVHLFRGVSVPTADMSYSAYTPEVIDELVQEANGYLKQIAEGLNPARGVKTTARIGTPATLVEEYISGHAIDLVVMTTHGRGGLVRSALGSVTDRLLGAEAPILVVHPRNEQS